MRYSIPAGLLIVTLLAFGCSTENPLGSKGNVPAIPETLQFTGPQSSNAPEHLQQVLNLINSYTSLGNLILSAVRFSSPESSGNTHTWAIQIDSLAITVQATPLGEDQVEWVITVDGSYQGISYDQWVYMRGTASKDGSSGSWQIHEEGTTRVVATLEWQVDKQGVRKGNFFILETGVKYVIVNNPDLSGRLTEYLNDVKVFEAVWDSSGAGSWTSWDASGTLTGSGTWG